MSEKLKTSVVLNSNADLKIQKHLTFRFFLLFFKCILLTLPLGILSEVINSAHFILAPVIEISVDLWKSNSIQILGSKSKSNTHNLYFSKHFWFMTTILFKYILSKVINSAYTILIFYIHISVGLLKSKM